MISFSLTSDQKRATLNSILLNLESQIYQFILILGGDPDSYDFTQIEAMKDTPAPSTENQLYVSYNRYLNIKEKIENL